MNINRDYLIINDVKKSNVKLDNGSIFFYITDKNTQNIFVNLVINVSNNDLIQKYANIENAEDYTLTMNIVKPSNTYKVVEGKLHDKEKAIFEFDLNEDCCDEIGTYRCELLTKCNINDREEITTSNKLTYKVKSSVLNDLDDIVEAPEYPLVIQLFDKLSDIEQYEEDRRANELARQLAEEQRQARFNTLDADMTDRVTAMDNKMVDVENRVSTKEQAVDTLIVDTKADIDDYKVAKDQEIDEYKTAKDTEINEAITAQDNKIDTAISNQNDRITLVENNDATQNARLDVLENRDTIHESRLDAIEAKNTEQDSRLDIVENKNTQQDNRLNDIEAKNVEQDNRLDDIEAIDVAQNSRLDAIEVKNQQQDDRLLDIEKVNKRQDMNLKCLFAESKNNMIDVTEEGNSIYLQNSTIGYTLIDEIKGNTLVNCNKEPDKELILNGNINTSGYNNITITEGIDGGLVDVMCEGNTLVNLVNMPNILHCTNNDDRVKQLNFNQSLKVGGTYTLLFNVYNTNGIPFNVGIYNPSQMEGTWLGEFNGDNFYKQVFVLEHFTDSHRLWIWLPNDAGGTLSIDNLTLLEGDWTNKEVPTKYFEGMKSVGQDDVNGHKIEIVSSNSDNTLSNKKEIPLNEPLRAVGNAKDRYVLIDGKWYIERRCEEVVFDGSDDERWVYNFIRNNLIVFYLKPYNLKKNIYTCVCDKLCNVNIAFIAIDREGISLDGTGNLHLCLSTNKVNNSNSLYLKQWLQENPLKVVYQLNIPTYEPIDYNPLEVYSGTTNIATNSAIPCNIVVKNHGFNCLLKPSTTYTISSNLGLNTVTTPSVLTEDYLRFMDTDTSDVTTMKDVLVLEGDWTTKANLIPANFSGMESAFEQEYDAEKGKYKVNVKVANEDKSKENNITFYINEPLRGVEGVKDKIFIQDDKVVVQRNCGSITFDGSDDEKWYKVADGEYPEYLGVINSGYSFGKCNNFKYAPNGNYERFAIDGINLYIKIHNVKLQTQDVQGFRQWLQQNPTTVVYQLAEPTYEEVEYNDTKLFIESFKNSTLSYNSNVPVTSKLYYSYSVPIVDTVAQTANISDQQDSMIIDLATQVAVMEMMLM